MKLQCYKIMSRGDELFGDGAVWGIKNQYGQKFGLYLHRHEGLGWTMHSGDRIHPRSSEIVQTLGPERYYATRREAVQSAAGAMLALGINDDQFDDE